MIPLADLLEVVGEDAEALLWLRHLQPETKEQAAEWFAEHWLENRAYMDALRERFESGDREALFRLIDTAATFHVPLPQWAADAFSEGWARYTDFDYIAPKGKVGRRAALGGAFGIERTSAHQPAAQRQSRYGPIAYRVVEDYIREAERAGKKPLETNIYKQVSAEIADPPPHSILNAALRLAGLAPAEIDWQTIRNWHQATRGPKRPQKMRQISAEDYFGKG